MISDFLGNEDGTVTVEFTLWLTIMTAFMMVSADAAFLLSKHAELYDTTRAATRQLATGQMEPSDMERFMELRWGEKHPYSHTVDTVDGFVTVTMSVGFSDVTTFTGTFVPQQVLTGRAVMAEELG